MQYGPRFRALAVCLTQHQMLPAKRTGELPGARCGVHPSTGTVMNLIREAGRRLEPSHRKIAETLLRQPVAGADETGVRAGRRYRLATMT